MIDPQQIIMRSFDIPPPKNQNSQHYQNGPDAVASASPNSIPGQIPARSLDLWWFDWLLECGSGSGIYFYKYLTSYALISLKAYRVLFYLYIKVLSKFRTDSYPGSWLNIKFKVDLFLSGNHPVL